MTLISGMAFRVRCLLLALVACCMAPWAVAQDPTPTWQHLIQNAKGSTVYFYTWGGNPQANDYLRWSAEELERDYQIKLVQVKVADIAEAMALIVADRSAGNSTAGKVDLIWINGENFAALKSAKLLHPFSQTLPNSAEVDGTLPIQNDFGVPVEGHESPWGVGQLVLLFDREQTPKAPSSAAELLAYAKANPGRISYPKPPQFHGVAFLKQLLLELTPDPSKLSRPVNEAEFAQLTAPLWSYLDQLHSVAWNQGQSFAQSDRQMLQLLDDGELDMAISFNPLEAKSAIERGDLEPSVYAASWSAGALTNVHFVAIPYNSAVKPAAQVVANFLLAPKAQQRKAAAEYWGDPSVLRSREPLPQKALAEPHFSWHNALIAAWQHRYGS